MAQSVKVIRQTLSATLNGTTDFTSSSFGTPSAAIIVMCSAGASVNPSANANISIGLWDGTSQRVVDIGTVDNVAQANAYRFSDDTYGAAAVASGISALYSVSGITDGIRLTLSVDNTGVQRFCTVMLFAGVSAKLLTFTPNATQNATQESASLGLAPRLIFFASIAATTTDVAAGSTPAVMSFGVAEAGGTHRMLTFYSEHLTLTEEAAILYSETRCVGQVNTSGVTWSGEVTAWGSDTFTMTTRDGATGGDLCFALALGGADLSYDIGTLSTATSATTQQNATDIAPDALLIALSTATGTSLHTDSGANGYMIGLADNNGQFCHNISVEDGAETTNTNSTAQSSRIIDLDTSVSGSLTDMCDATVTLNSADFTLSFSAADATARKGWWVAFGPAAAGGGAAVERYCFQELNGGMQSLGAGYIAG